MRLLCYKRKGSAGFTLIELLIAMVITMIIVGAIYSAYKSQQDSYLAQEQVAETQQNLRVALVFLTNDIRMAGFDPTSTGNPTIVSASSGAIHITKDSTGGESDGDDNDEDGTTDESDESTYGDGDTADAGEDVQYGLSDDDNSNGIADSLEAGTQGASDDDHSDLGRDTGGGLQAIAENIDCIEFFYTMDDGTQTLTPPAANLDDIRAVEVSILARANHMDREFNNNITYTTASGDTWGPFNDNYRRRFVSMTIQARNMEF